ncbi:putative Reverse transcriptase (RNA-dependent DNA polymerase) [Blattamonas nauphoetae]|uniref:Reverse transcriptase (RNA-dependent DNA polymerase) n=1 Tax=Blattamonas nauphoetae TaxID=2049346 RepID=A0ABQ9WMB3_9EUKA|nr:putative Reverse transcriptase (RNA-dependent DNA polymerase) [Blattamonas nauphoetae]
MDGITAELIKRLCSRNRNLGAHLTNTIQLCLQKSFLPEAWCVCRLVPIPKANGKLRPIAVQHTLRKAMARMLLIRNKKWFEERTAKRQKGVNTPLGRNRIISRVEERLDSAIEEGGDVYIAALDLSNAYQNVKRQLLLNKVTEDPNHDPELAHFLKLSFEQETLVLDMKGQSSVIPNTRGVQQGCPLSPSLFGLYLTEPMEEAEKHGAEVWAYLDDTVIIANSQRQLEKTVSTLHTSLIAHNLCINPSKTEMIIIEKGRIVKETRTILGSEVETKESYKLLGSLITRDQKKRDEFFEERINRIKSILPLAKELSHQAHLHLIRQALFTKPIHLLSSMRITRDALVRADEMITDHIASIFEIPPDRHFLIFQPIKKGGLGMPSFVRTADTALLCTQGSIDPTLWDIDAVTEERARQRDQSGNESSFGARKVAEQMLLQLTEEERKAGAKGQKELRGIFEEREKRNELNLLPTYQQNRHKVIEDGISQRWLNILPKDRYHKLNNHSVVTSLDHLFLKNPLSWDIVAGVKEEEDQEEESERKQDVGRKKGKIKLKCPLCLGEMRKDHAGCCSINGATRTARHSAIKHLLTQTLKEIPPLNARTEQKMGRDDEKEENIPETIADISISLTTSHLSHSFIKLLAHNEDKGRVVEFGLDLVVCQDFTSRTSGRLENTRGRVEEGERKKKRKYERTNQEKTIIGIGMSDNGILGPNAESFFDFIRVLAKEQRVTNPIPAFLTKYTIITEMTRSHMEAQYVRTVERLRKKEEERKQERSMTTLENEALNLMLQIDPGSIPRTSTLHLTNTTPTIPQHLVLTNAYPSFSSTQPLRSTQHYTPSPSNNLPILPTPSSLLQLHNHSPLRHTNPTCTLGSEKERSEKRQTGEEDPREDRTQKKREEWKKRDEEEEKKEADIGPDAKEKADRAAERTKKEVQEEKRPTSKIPTGPSERQPQPPLTSLHNPHFQFSNSSNTTFLSSLLTQEPKEDRNNSEQRDKRGEGKKESEKKNLERTTEAEE